MYNIDMNQAASSGADQDFGSGYYATGPFNSTANNTLYSIPMDAAADPLAVDGGYLGVSGADGNSTATAAGVEPGTVMYVSAINQGSLEYATAVANEALYSVVSKPGRGGASNYDVAVHQAGGGEPASMEEYSHLAPRNDGAGQQQQQQQQGSNNHYDAGNPRRAVVAQSTVYATAAVDQNAGSGNAANYDVAVHQGAGPATTGE